MTGNQVRVGLPPGVVVFPSGNMLLTASTGLRFQDIPEGNLEYLQFKVGADGRTLKVLPRIKLSPRDLDRLRDDFQTLRMVFPVR